MNRIFSLALCLALPMLFTNACCEPLPQPRSQAESPPPVASAAVAAPVLSLPSDMSNTVSFSFMFAAGSADDPNGKRGLTMLTASLIAQSGTEKLSYSEVGERLFPMAAQIGVNVSRDTTTFSGRVHRERLEDYYGIFKDVLLHPGMHAADFSRVKQSQLMALTRNLRGTNDEELGKAALQWHLYRGHPYAHPELGVEEDLSSITADDVTSHRVRAFCSSRLTIGIAGAIPDGFNERVAQDMKQLPTECTERPALPAPPTPDGPRVLLVDKPSAESTAISIGFPIDVTRGHKDYAALKLIESYFGQHRTFTGKLQYAIRIIRGMNYGNYAYVEHFEQEGYSKLPSVNQSRRQQYFSIWLRPVKDSQKHFALRLALHQLSEMLTNGISQKELDATRQYVKRYYLTYSQTEARKLGYALDDHFYQLPKPYFSSLFEDLDKLTTDDLRRVLDAYMRNQDFAIAMVTKNAQGFATELAADAISPMSYSADSSKGEEILNEDTQVSVMKLNIDAGNIDIVSAANIF